MNTVPFYERDLDSFADEIITSVRLGDNGTWYAVIDTGPDFHSGTDFSTGASTREIVVRRCAQKIREDHRGIGKFAPHGIMRGYDFRWRLCKWWAQKEAAAPSPRAAGEGAASEGEE